jgi:Halocarboxylic acid dehydrogenase DehI
MRDSLQVRQQHAADLAGDIFDDIKATLRTSVVNLPFPLWARNPQLLKMLWTRLKPNLQSRFAESAADTIRERAVTLMAARFVPDRWIWENQEDEKTALTLEMARYVVNIHHYLDPKLLMMISILLETMQHHNFKPVTDPTKLETVPRGVPLEMPELQLSQILASRSQTSVILDEIQRAMRLPKMSSDYLSLSLCPGFLAKAWAKLQPMVAKEAYWMMADGLQSMAAVLARKAPFPIGIQLELIYKTGTSRAEAVHWVMQTHTALAGLVLNMAALKIGLDGKEGALQSPYPIV